MSVSTIRILSARNRGRRVVSAAPVFLALAILAFWAGAPLQSQSGTLQFLFTSDAHYGLTRPTFQGRAVVDAHTVNAAMVAKMNTLAAVRFPMDEGLRAGEKVGPVEFLAEGGDIANRAEVLESGVIQSAATSWSQFRADYVDGFRLIDSTGARARVYMVPGNHDVSNAVGWIRPMSLPTDKTSMVAIYNLMMAPPVLKAPSTYDYARDKVLVSHDIGGIHFMFITMWPDSGVRAWMEHDLERVGASTPAIVFTHDQPESEAKHFTNPNGRHDINEADKFENLLVDRLADGTAITEKTVVEQRALEAFLVRHPNLTAYFHGNSNWNQFYDWTGPDPHAGLALHTFRVDSPMKGAISAKDEKKLSFHVATIDTASRRMTVRECLWNTDPSRPSAGVVWGESRTVTLAPRQPLHD